MRNANFPVLPIAGGALVGAFVALLAMITRWLKELARARQHRRQANVLAGLDRHMLTDIGITRADVRDAFSEPFWDDPTALLRERATQLVTQSIYWNTVNIGTGLILLLGAQAMRTGDFTVPARGRIQRPPAPPAGAIIWQDKFSQMSGNFTDLHNDFWVR